jgi:cell division protein FtsW
MVIKIDRRGNNSFRKWWWTIDSISFFLIFAIILVGTLLITTASPSVAERLKLNSFYFVHRQFIFLFISIFIIIFLSNISEKDLRRLSLLGFTICILLMMAVLFTGEEVKGSKRWFGLFGFSIQPSEIIKPFFIALAGMLLAEKYNRTNFPGFSMVIIINVLVCILLILQPDFGMVITYNIVTAGQFFLAGLAIWWIFLAIIIGIVGGFCAYNFFPHVARRIDHFINPEVNENFGILY